MSEVVAASGLIHHPNGGSFMRLHDTTSHKRVVFTLPIFIQWNQNLIFLILNVLFYLVIISMIPAPLPQCHTFFISSFL